MAEKRLVDRISTWVSPRWLVGLLTVEVLAVLLGRLAVLTVWVVRSWRTELALAASVLVLWLAVRPRLTDQGFALLVLVLVVAVAVTEWRFGRPSLLLHRARVRRRWEHACRYARLETDEYRVPVVRRLRRVPVGDVCRVKVPPGSSVPLLEAQREIVAAALGLRDVRVLRDEANAALAEVTLVRRDPLALSGALVWPHVDAGRLSLWEPIPVGVDENVEPVHLLLPERNVLIGGEPGAGKSAAASLILATAALDPEVRLSLLDGKLVELAVWRSCADHAVGADVDEAIDVLRLLQAEMAARYQRLLAEGRRKITRAEGLPLHLVAIDEMAFYLQTEDRKQRQELSGLTRDLVSRGRAAGIVVVGATQKPSGDVVPTALRDLFGFRWALRCSTRDASDTILGAGWASLGYSAATIPGALRGVGYLLAEGQAPARLLSYYLDDDALAAIAARAHALRQVHAADQGNGDDEPPALGVVA